MAQSGFTPIQLYFSTTGAAVPSAGNLANGELAINITDGRLFYKDNSGTVQVLATKAGANGDVVGPASATDNALVRFDNISGKLVQNSVGILDDSGNLSGIAALTTSGALTLNGGTANGVAYLNGSKVLTTGSALTFDGTNLGVGASSVTAIFGRTVQVGSGATENTVSLVGPTGAVFLATVGATGQLIARGGSSLVFGANDVEQMRLTSTGLGIGTSSPAYKLDVAGSMRLGNSQWLYFNDSGTGIYGEAGGSGSLQFRTNGSTRATLDSSGNLGLGVTPSAWDGSLFKTLQLVRAGGAYLTSFSGSLNMQLGYNVYYGSGAYRYSETGTAARYIQTAGEHQFYTAPSGTAGNAITFTQAMTLDASGNLGVGTTSPTSFGAGAIMQTVAGTTSYGGYLGSTNSVTVQMWADQTGSGTMGTRTNHPLLLTTNNTERARITSGGNFGIGTSSPAERLQVAGSIRVTSNANDFNVLGGQFDFAGDSTRIAAYNASGSTIQFYTNASGGNVAERARIDPNGNFLVGTNTVLYSSAGRGVIEVNGGSTAIYALKVGNAGAGYLYHDGASLSAWNVLSGSLIFGTSNIERARIDSSGNLLVGTTSRISNERMAVQNTGNTEAASFRNTVESYATLLVRNDGTGGTRNLTQYRVGTTDVGWVSSNGTTVAYNTTSDYRLKEDIRPMTGALARVQQLKPCTYKWKATGEDSEGFIAHELAEVCPDAVAGEKDAVDAKGNPKYQGIDTSFLVATLTAAIQELKAEFDAYKATHP